MGIQREQADRATRQETRGVLREGRARTDKARTQVEDAEAGCTEAPR
jgi:hypothetical protein